MTKIRITYLKADPYNSFNWIHDSMVIIRNSDGTEHYCALINYTYNGSDMVANGYHEYDCYGDGATGSRIIIRRPDNSAKLAFCGIRVYGTEDPWARITATEN